MVGRTRTIPISFRVDENTYRHVEERAKECGTSPGVFVRGILISELHRPLNDVSEQLSDLISKVSEIEQTIYDVRLRQARSLYFALTMIGKVPNDTATQIVLTKLTKETANGRVD